jgi:hypothetical protein
MREYDRSLVEVWEWKEQVYQTVKDLSPREYIEKLRSDTDKLLSENKIKLNVVFPKKHYQEVA